ncbi:MAG TPA: hypothetical protein VKE69_12600, partial [Planctomycetota bacterium]|nr:hypothetical protein [Planctomycetota bacterium]
FAETAHARLGPAATAALRYDAALELGRARAAALAAGSGTQNGAADALAAGAQTALVEAAHTRPDSIDPLLELAAMSAGRGEVAAACAFLDEAVSVAPDDARGHQRLRDVCVNAKDPARLRAIYDLLESRHPDSATVRWFGGFARLYEADERRRARAFDDADRGYDAALGSLERSRELNPAFVNAKQLEALALAGKARILFDKGETGDAVDVLTEAIEREPKALDATDALGISPKRTSLEIGGAYFEAGDLERGAAAFERWIAVVPDDVDWRNNAGLSLRDLGESLERRDQRDRAHECFERSFEHYRHVAELRPDEPRLVNDAALILLYHLHRDLDAAEEMFRRAIRLGEDKLAELGGERPETSDDDPASLGAARVYDYFAEATGDACQNLGLLLQQRSGDAAEIRALWRRALELDPRGTRGRIRGWIDSLPMSGPVSRPALIPR